MRNIKMFGLAVLAALGLTAMLGVGMASAANFDPANKTVHAHGTLTLTTNVGSAVTCNFTTFLTSPGNDHAVTVDATNMAAGPSFSGCTNTISSGLSTSVVATPGTTGAWTLTATSTSTINVTNGGATINIGGICTITAMGVSVPNNAWNETTHVLTPNNGVTFPISESGFCDGATTGRMSGSVIATGATIT
jgi:hypothetical protein